MQYAQANGLKFAYLESGTGPLVLMAHGFPDTAHSFDAIRPVLADAGYRVVAPFMRGYPPTELPEIDRYDAETLGLDLLGLIEALGEDSAIVVGHDFGAVAAYAAATLAPERLGRLIVIGTPHPGIFVLGPEFLERVPHFGYLTGEDGVSIMEANDYAHVEVLYNRWSPTWFPGPADFEATKNAFAAPGYLYAALGYYRAIVTAGLPDLFDSHISVPTLMVAGPRDFVIPPEAYEAARVMYDGLYEVVTLPAGHFAHREKPVQFAEAVLAFLRK